jgi:hypothetical protein
MWEGSSVMGSPIPIDFIGVVSCDFAGKKIIKCLSVAGTFFKNGKPAQTGLCSFKEQKFKEGMIIMYRYTPLPVVIMDVNRIAAGPLTAFFVNALDESVLFHYIRKI